MAAALDYLHCGDLVPDSTVREMVRERGCLLVLDGFPGTLGQDETLSQLMEKENLALSAVVNYELPVAEIVSRLSGRRTCEKCKAVFHVTRQPSRSEGICDECGGTAVPVLSPTRAARAGRRYWIARRNLRAHHECLGKTPRLAFVETGL
jgi:adenylate kinase